MLGWLSSMFGAEQRERVDPRHPKDPVLAAWFGGQQGAMSVTPDSAMKVTAVYASVSLIAETVAALPLHVYQVTNGETQKAYSHPLYPVIHDYTAHGLTSYEWREAMVAHCALRGDAFARIVMNGKGQVTDLPMIHPDHILVERGANGKIRYRWREDGGKREIILLEDEVLRIPHKLMDGVNSLSPIALHRETISTSLASRSYLDQIYQNSAQPKGALKFSGSLSKEAGAAIRKAWEERHQGPENAGRVAILDGGMEWQQIGMTMEDQQFIELQNFSVADIARIFGVPPHKIGDLSRATFSNIEHQSIAFVTDTIMRWVRRIESRMNWYLLSPNERTRGYFIAFDLKGLLRGDAAARSNFYRSMFYIGAMNPNEIRAAEDMNPYDGGNSYFVQGATVPIDMADDEPDPALPEGGDDQDEV